MERARLASDNLALEERQLDLQIGVGVSHFLKPSCDRDLHTQLLEALASQRCRVAFARLDLASRELPEQTSRSFRPPLLDQHCLVSLDQGGHDPHPP